MRRRSTNNTDTMTASEFRRLISGDLPRNSITTPIGNRGENVRAITYTLDFYLPDYDMAIDTKGMATQQGKLRIKMLKRLFADLGRTTTIELPRTKDECAALVARLTSNR